MNHKLFLEFATYNRLFDHVQVNDDIAAWLKESDLCHVESDNTVWYPKHNWILELERRKNVNRTFARTPEQIKNELITATIKGDLNRMSELTKEYEQAKKK